VKLALALAVVAAAGCGGAHSPDGAVRALTEAAEAGDRAAVYQLLGPATRARLTADAARAAVAAGRRDIRPEELLGAGWSPPRWRANEFETIARQGDRATVEIRGKHGERERVDCLYTDGHWHVELSP
jgi:hypothetical protein